MSVMSMLSLAERAQVPPIMGEHRTTGLVARSKRALGACPRSLEFHVVPCRDSQERRRDRAIRSRCACTTRRVTKFSRYQKGGLHAQVATALQFPSRYRCTRHRACDWLRRGSVARAAARADLRGV